MERYELTIRLIYDAIGEINENKHENKPEQTLDPTPDTVLIGESAKLDSLDFVNLFVSIEEKVRMAFNREISLPDIMALAEGNRWTVAALAKCIVDQVTRGPQDQAPVQTFSVL